MKNTVNTKSVTPLIFEIIITAVYVPTTYRFLRIIQRFKIRNLVILSKIYESFQRFFLLSIFIFTYLKKVIFEKIKVIKQ